MTPSRPRRSVAATIVIAGLVAIAAWCAWMIVQRTPHERPYAEIVGWVIAIAAEAIAVATALRRTERVGSLAFVIGVLGVLAVVPLAIISYGARPGFLAHAFWILCAGGWLVTMAIAIAIAQLCVRKRPDVPRARALEARR